MGVITAKELVDTSRYFCDVCTELCQPFHRECCVCKNVVCPKAVCHEIWGNDTFCKFCWDLREPHMTNLYAELEAFKERQNAIHREWLASSHASQGKGRMIQ